ncbi:hypothetical protein [Rhodoferax sp. BAB1]|uniref:hypothetical protein n=1 Tax=Rhodoferax sp. BAB1 TaxID=2741720 RepID=UPI0020C6107C|nr:hypothetical protein [Rhodoferax sp. BAB1]
MDPEKFHRVDEDKDVGPQMNDGRLNGTNPPEEHRRDAEDVHHTDADNNVLLDSAIARAAAIFRRSSIIRAMSAASSADWVPPPPMAMPTSARARAGAALMPSPTIATL